MPLTIYEAVKKSIPVPDAAARYGMVVGKNGMTLCPFHDDRNPSMKLNDEYYYCFGCGVDGDVIDLTAALCGLNKYDAARKLAQDFGVDYEILHPDMVAVQKKYADRKRQAERERKVFIALTERLYLLRDWIVRYAPKTSDEELDPRFVEACHDLDRVEYLVDVLCTGDEIERREVVKMMLSGDVRDSPVDRAG